MSLSGGTGVEVDVQVQNVQATMGTGSSISTGSFIAGTTTLSSGQITDTTGVVSFGADSVRTTGGFRGDVVSANDAACLDNGETPTAATFTGTAAKADQLSTARTIATVSFDGTDDIDLQAINLTDIDSVGSKSIITATERSKLSGIEAGANITSDANGAVMKTGAQTISGVKTFSDQIAGSINGSAETSKMVQNGTGNGAYPITFITTAQTNSYQNQKYDPSFTYNPRLGELVLTGDGAVPPTEYPGLVIEELLNDTKLKVFVDTDTGVSHGKVYANGIMDLRLGTGGAGKMIINTSNQVLLASGVSLLKNTDPYYYEYTTREIGLYYASSGGNLRWVPFFNPSEQSSPNQSTSLLLASDTFVRAVKVSLSTNYTYSFNSPFGLVGAVVKWAPDAEPSDSTDTQIQSIVLASVTAHKVYTFDLSAQSEIDANSRLGMYFTIGNSSSTSVSITMILQQKKSTY